jgi:Eukaryotic protein of unknown function (DUF866)
MIIIKYLRKVMRKAVAVERQILSGSVKIARFVGHDNLFPCKDSHRCSRLPLESTQREHSANIKDSPNPYELSSPPKRINVIELDCRGLEFVEFKPDGEWLAEGAESGTKFTAIELSEGEWYDYDEKASSEVTIKDLKWEIRRT